MTLELTIKKEYEVKTMVVGANVRYWEDATLNGDVDEDGKMPCRVGDLWCPEINVDTGQILNWIKGSTAEIHYKVCDEGVYTLFDDNGNEITKIDGYVPDCMSPKDYGYGDYIIMNIDENGFIQDWQFSVSGFETED